MQTGNSRTESALNFFFHAVCLLVSFLRNWSLWHFEICLLQVY